jgi:hypothetical protein
MRHWVFNELKYNELARANGIFSIFPAVSRHFFIVCFLMQFDNWVFYGYACIKMTIAKRTLKGTKGKKIRRRRTWMQLKGISMN